MNLLSLCAVVFLLKINYNNFFEKEKKCYEWRSVQNSKMQSRFI